MTMVEGVRAAPLRGWQRRCHAESVWSTVVTVDVRGPELPGDRVSELFTAAAAFTHQVDRWFSTFRSDSAICALRAGRLTTGTAPDAVQSVLAQCRHARAITAGAFDPWAMPGGLDPAGLVKGWAADRIASMALDAGFPNVCVNAGGDIACRGEQSFGQSWSVGVAHPGRRDQIAATASLRDMGMATSGRYERGDHIVDPRSGQPAMALDSATVVGPDCGLADALATALVVRGPSGVEYFQSLPGWSGYLISGERVQMFGPAFVAE